MGLGLVGSLDGGKMGDAPKSGVNVTLGIPFGGHARVGLTYFCGRSKKDHATGARSDAQPGPNVALR